MTWGPEMLSTILHEPLVVWTLRSFLAALFLTAALSKLTAIDEFHGVVRNFRLLPDGLARPESCAASRRPEARAGWRTASQDPMSWVVRICGPRPRCVTLRSSLPVPASKMCSVCVPADRA